jgi:WW domain-containing oxidoreductase
MGNWLLLQELRAASDFPPQFSALNGNYSSSFSRFTVFFRGASLLLLCRNLSKMSAAADEIRENAPGTQILEFELDLADTKTVSKAIKEIKMREIKIDILVLNAGLYYYEPTECLYNINSIQVVNHYSHFYLLNELLENLKV